MMKVKVCYACVHVTGTFGHQNRPKHAVFNKRLKKIFWGGDTPSPHPTPLGAFSSSILALSAPRLYRLRRWTSAPRGPLERNVWMRHCLLVYLLNPIRLNCVQIAAISPDAENYEQTLSTLRYGLCLSLFLANIVIS